MSNQPPHAFGVGRLHSVLDCATRLLLAICSQLEIKKKMLCLRLMTAHRLLFFQIQCNTKLLIVLLVMLCPYVQVQITCLHRQNKNSIHINTNV